MLKTVGMGHSTRGDVGDTSRAFAARSTALSVALIFVAIAARGGAVGKYEQSESCRIEGVCDGAPVALPEGAGALVRLRGDEPAGTCMSPEGENYAEGCRRARLAAERIVERWGGTDATVLVVGHACNGARVRRASSLAAC